MESDRERNFLSVQTNAGANESLTVYNFYLKCLPNARGSFVGVVCGASATDGADIHAYTQSDVRILHKIWYILCNLRPEFNVWLFYFRKSCFLLHSYIPSILLPSIKCECENISIYYADIDYLFTYAMRYIEMNTNFYGFSKEL